MSAGLHYNWDWLRYEIDWDSQRMCACIDWQRERLFVIIQCYIPLFQVVFVQSVTHVDKGFFQFAKYHTDISLRQSRPAQLQQFQQARKLQATLEGCNPKL